MDGKTGRTRTEKCHLCEQDMVSAEFIVMGRHLWTRVHDACSERYHEIIHEKTTFKVKPTNITDAHWETLVNREEKETPKKWYQDL